MQIVPMGVVSVVETQIIWGSRIHVSGSVTRIGKRRADLPLTRRPAQVARGTDPPVLGVAIQTRRDRVSGPDSPPADDLAKSHRRVGCAM